MSQRREKTATADPTSLPCYDEHGDLLVVVETPRGSTAKLKYEPAKGVYMFSRPLMLGVAYPYDWGFVPSTRAEDGDPLDAMVLFEGTTGVGVVIPSKPIGVVRIVQSEEGPTVRNDRIIAVPANDPRGHFEELPRRMRDELGQFFLVVSRMTKKRVELEGWSGPDEARAAIESAKPKTK